MNAPPDIDGGGEAPALDIGPILAIHRDPGGYIGFRRKCEPWIDRIGQTRTEEDLFSIRADELRSMLPAIQEYLLHDSYFTVNAYYAAAPWKNKNTGLPDVWRAETKLRSLAALYTDIDCGRPDSTEPGAALAWWEAVHRAGILAEAGIIPAPSIVARSGRGAYLFWLLRDAAHPERLPRAWLDSTIPLYKAINKAIGERLRLHSLPWDPVAYDAARVLRVPGSIHRKAGVRVEYIIMAHRGGGFVYTLPELAAALDIPALTDTLPEATRTLAKPKRTTRQTKKPGTAPGRRESRLALNALRASDLVKLQHHRGGFRKKGAAYPDGHISRGRQFMLSLYLDFLHGSRLPQAEAEAALRAMASNMLPPWPDEPNDPTPETLATERYKSDKPRNYKNDTLLPLLGITADLAEEIELQTIIPESLRAEREAALPTKQDIIKARREWLQDYILKHGGEWNGPRVMRLSAFSPHPWNNHFTATQDLNAIDYKVRSPGRPRKERKK